jgi:hypothetical protein
MRKFWSSLLMTAKPDRKPLKQNKKTERHMAARKLCHMQKGRQTNHMPPASWQVFYLAVPALPPESSLQP